MIQEYLIYLTNIRGYSARTVEAYEKDLKDFAQWLKLNKTNPRWGEVERSDVDSYIITLADAGFKPASTNRKLSAISSFYNYMKREGYNVNNPTYYESRRKIPKTLPKVIFTEELQNAYIHAIGVAQVVIGILATTGIRISELCSIHASDINYEDCSIRINGKGNKQRIVYTTPEILKPITLIKEHLPEQEPVFRMSPRYYRHLVYNALKPFCHARQLSPHAIRHTFATHLAEEGINVAVISRILGHERLETTQHYIDHAAYDLRPLFKEYSLLNR